MPEEFEEIQIEQAWVGAEDLPVHFANAFVGAYGPNAFFLNIGSQFPPEIESEEDFQRLKERGYVPVKPIARIALAPAGLDGLIEVLETIREEYQEISQHQKGQEP